MKNRKYLSFFAAIVMCGLVFASISLTSRIKELFAGSLASPPPTIIQATGTIEAAFSPNNGVTRTVVKAINEAQKTILVSAYSFTSKDIAAALLAAKKRGVDIKLVLDKSQVSQKYSSSTFFANQGFNMRIDVKHAIYHDKVIIIDDKTVITGSFNFTKAAETKNAENLLVFRNNPALARLYTQDWQYNWSQAISRNEFLDKYKDLKSRVSED